MSKRKLSGGAESSSAEKKRRCEEPTKASLTVLGDGELVGLIYSFGTVQDWHNWTRIDKAVWQPQLSLLRPPDWRPQLNWLRDGESQTVRLVLVEAFAHYVDSMPDDNTIQYKVVRCFQCRIPIAALASDGSAAEGVKSCAACIREKAQELDDRHVLDSELRTVCTWRARALAAND